MSEPTLYQTDDTCRHTQVTMLNDATGKGSRCRQCGGTLMFVVPVEPGLFVTGDFDSVSDMLDAAVGPNRSVTFQWIGGDDE